MATKKTERAITFEVNEAGDVLTFAAATGEKFALDLTALGEDARRNAIVFGVARKVTNAAALDAGATVGEKWAEVKAVAERLAAGGEWNSGSRASGGGAGGNGGLLVEAFRRVYGDDAAKVEATLVRTMEKKSLTRPKAIAFWSGTDKIATAIAEIKAERAKKAAAGANLDADEELAAMRDGAGE